MKTPHIPSCAVALAALAATASSTLAADLQLPRIFGDHMVLQRDKPVRVWGRADKGAPVAVEFAGQTQTAKAADDGAWGVELEPLALCAEGRELKVSSGSNKVAIKDVLVGDVWLGSGQSNMELELGGMERGDIAAFQADYPLIRLMDVPGETSDKPEDDIPGTEWKVCTPATAAGFSAVAFYFARDVHKGTKVPIGMIKSARGGTYPESWQTRESLESLKSPVVDKLLKFFDKRTADWLANPKGDDPRKGGMGLMLPAGCYNHMIHPIEKLAIRGALFYQGENSAVNNGGAGGGIEFAHGYPLTYPAVIRNWRQIFRDPELPFCIIEMAPWGGPGPLTSRDVVDCPSPFVRDVHLQTCLKWPHTGLAVTMDCGKVGDMHPTKKEPVGHRAALWALSQVYHVIPNRGWTGPLYRAMEIKGNKVVIRFHRNGLTLPLGLQNPAGKNDGFIIAGADKVWHVAQAAIVGEMIEVSSDKVPEPAAVRYAWADCQGLVNLLVNADGLPASPFRTDNWVATPIFDQQLLLPAEGARPWADAGPDQMVLTKAKTVMLDGGDSYSPDGGIVKYAWTKLSGPAVGMSGAETRTLTLSAPVQGSYVFRLTVTDKKGNTASDEVTARASDRSLPVANAGKDRMLPYPENSTVLDGSGSEVKLATIASYAWTQVSGPNKADLAGDKSAKASVSGLKEGTHVFRLTIADSLGEKASADVTIKVMPPAVPVIYEPFIGVAGEGLDGRGGMGDAGFSSKWVADKGAVITGGGLSYGNLATAGKALSLKTVATNGTFRTLDASALATRGLLADGAELWFSFLVSEVSNKGNFTGVMLGDSGTDAGNGVGVTFGDVNIPKATLKIGGVKSLSPGHAPYAIWQKNTALVVGKIKWGATGSAPDTVQLYLPGKDLAQPADNPVLVVSGVLDQSKFNVISVGPSPADERDAKIDEIRFGASYYDVVHGADSVAPDVTPPTPNPLQWGAPVPAVSDAIVTLTATKATDTNDVQYYFANTTVADNSHDSGWVDSPVWTDRGLSPNTKYVYQVKARDKSVKQNETGWSPRVSVATTAPDVAPPTPGPLQWAHVPAAVAPTVVTMTAATAKDPSGVEYYFANTTIADGSHDSGWISNTAYVDTGLSANTEYTYTVKARDKSVKQNQTVPAPAAKVRTKPAGLVIYEPFQYNPEADLDGQGGATDAGFAGKWVAEKKGGIVQSAGVSYGNLPVAGKALKWTGRSAARAINTSALMERGLLTDGAELWFSMVVSAKVCVNIPSGSIFLEDTKKQNGNRVGMDFWRYASIKGIMRNAGIDSRSPGGDDVGTAPVLVVGRVMWGLGENAQDIVQIYLPGKDLALPPANPVNAVMAVMDQSNFDSLRIECQGGDGMTIGEIRFGATYADVIGGVSPAAQTAAATKNARYAVREIASARYAPPDMYMKDHCLIRKDGQWHLFAPLGKVGTMWQHEGSEESAEHMVSDDLVHWKLLGTAVSASKREGCFDRLMGGIAPQVIPQRDECLMFYAGWDFKSKTPLDLQGQRSGIGLAKSRDLVKWEKPEEFAKDGLAPKGSDPCVVRDDAQRRWVMYVGRPGAVAVYQNMDDWRKDLTYWEDAGLALTRADLAGGTTDMNPGESPFVMKHPRSGKWIMFVNGGYAVSEDSLKFPRVQPYPFKAGVVLFPKPHDEGQGTFYHADDDGAGFAHEIIEFNGQWYMTGVVGTDGHTRLKFTPIEWTKDSVRSVGEQ